MATFTGTNADETITTQTLSPTVVANPAGSKPGSGADVINAGGGNDTVAAGGGADQIFLGAGNDVFNWRTGDGHDTVDGGADFDIVVFRGSDGNENIDVSNESGRVEARLGTIGSVSMAGIEKLMIQPSIAADSIDIFDLRGTGLSEIEIDLGSTDVPGPDLERDLIEISGSDSGDQISVSASSGAVIISGYGPTVTIRNQNKGGGIEDDLTIKGFAGDDTLDLSALPADTGMSFVAYGGEGDDILKGGAGSETLLGNSGDDFMLGSFGADLLLGSFGGSGDQDAGVDTVSYAGSKGAVNVDLATGVGRGGHAEGDILDQIENLIGGSSPDTLAGDDKANRLDGGAGDDTMAGGRGDDTYIADHLADEIIEKAGEGVDTVIASVTFSLDANVEKLVLTGNANIEGSGNSLANEITGNGGDNLLDGKRGADVMIGRKGHDEYFVDDAGDVVVEAAGGGQDTVFSSVTFTLGANVENLSLFDAAGGASKAAKSGDGSTAAAAATGNALANTIVGDTRDNLLAGREGNDTLNGGGGKDRFLFDTALDRKTNVDLIADFKRKKDKILLDADIFDGLDAGRLKKDAFYKAKKGKAKEGDDRIGYDKKSGALYFDTDGRGGDKAVKFAVLDDGPARLAAKDFLIVT